MWSEQYKIIMKDVTKYDEEDVARAWEIIFPFHRFYDENLTAQTSEWNLQRQRMKALQNKTADKEKQKNKKAGKRAGATLDKGRKALDQKAVGKAKTGAAVRKGRDEQPRAPGDGVLVPPDHIPRGQASRRACAP